MRAWEGAQEWRLLYMGASNLLMLRCAAEGRASKHAPAAGRRIGMVASFEARVRSHLRMRAWEGAQEWTLLYLGASNLLMLRVRGRRPSLEHAPAAGRCIGIVRPSRLAPLAPQDEGLGRADGPGRRPIIMLADEVLYCRALAMPRVR